MSVIYLKHPIHGTKVAISDAEADYDTQNGWSRYTLDDPEESNALATRRPRRAAAVEE